MSNLTKVFTLTKRMFNLTKNMGHERHMVLFWLVFLIEMDILTMLNLTSNQEGQSFKMVHQNAHGHSK